jgi:hypothetical protein
MLRNVHVMDRDRMVGKRVNVIRNIRRGRKSDWMRENWRLELIIESITGEQTILVATQIISVG